MRGGPLAQAHLLQLSLLELKAVVQQELQENPFLEEESETCDRPPSSYSEGRALHWSSTFDGSFGWRRAIPLLVQSAKR
jgi:DNA-directed RNA polymerase specialized sigma54-like protein